MDNNQEHISITPLDINGHDDFVYHATEEQKKKSRLGSMEEFWKMHRKSLDDPDAFWGEAAAPFYWKTPVPKKNICNYNIDVTKGKVFIEWMKGATTNICYNALDRNIEQGHGDQIAFYWEGNDPQDYDKITYKELLRRVCKFANVLKSKGVQKGDMVALYMPLVFESIIAMYACARIGAVHSVVFGGYSSESLAERILDGRCKVLVTADGVWRGAKLVHLKNIADKSFEICRKRGHIMTSMIVVEHQMRLTSTKNLLNGLVNGNGKCINGYNLEVSWNSKVDAWWHKEMEFASEICNPVWVDAEHTLFTLYTSGSTGKPKGCVHTTGAYMVYGALSFKYVFDYFPGDIFFCTGDIGWLTGHTYSVYGPLLNTATCILFEGVPTHPDPGRYWEIIEKYGATHFYTAPTAIRTLMKYDDSYVTRHNRSTLRVLASVGEPINKDAWFWFHQLVGEGRCPIVDTFWQTETQGVKIPVIDTSRKWFVYRDTQENSNTLRQWGKLQGGHLMTPMPFCTPLKPGCCALPFFGVEPALLDEDGQEIEGSGKGYLVIKRPWPAIMRTIYRNHERFENTYFSRFPGYYFTGDGGFRDEDGLYWVTGRVDDRLNVSGHLLSTMEVEAALVDHPCIAETAVVPHPHPVKGECLYCFIVLKDGYEFNDRLVQDLWQQVVHRIGSFAKPEYIHHATALPKTRSGKTVRRILRKIANNDRDLGDLSTLIDEHIVEELFESRKSVKSITRTTNNSS